MKSVVVVIVLAVPVAADGPAGPTSAAPAPAPLAKKDRDQLAGLLRKVAPKAKPDMAHAPQTLTEARRMANVPAWLPWQVEFDGWFVFGVRDRAGGADVWSGVYFVRKGTNVVGYYRETW
ncbi:MAG TPA: hypothetical protein VM597_18020 [Gemmataceae bacterium]|nr:hypothetical protein [Gemmataceae bacterium]